MTLKSINPASGQLLHTYKMHGDLEINSILDEVEVAQKGWASTPIRERAEIVRQIGDVLRTYLDQCAMLITQEMGKLISESRAEIEKCALVCDYYADHGERFLSDEAIETDASRSYVSYQPLGTILAVMPWNFPFWQVIRFAAPALVAGNAAILKHASNVSGCALKIEQLLVNAGLPENVFRTLLVGSEQVGTLLADSRIHAATLTGSDKAGRSVAAIAGANLKKTVLELGGSDPFVVLEDADLDKAAEVAVRARFQNTGQSCIAAKRFIIVDDIADEFLCSFRKRVEMLKPGNPLEAETTLSTMSGKRLRDELHEQVRDALDKGAHAVTGCAPLMSGVFGDGAYYQPSILAGVNRSMRAWSEELFGPVAVVIRVRSESEALHVANDIPFGLGGSVWTSDQQRGELFALQLQSGVAFVNGMVKSDPRLPFGGTKASGYGRELALHGIREFVNQKTLWVA